MAKEKNLGSTNDVSRHLGRRKIKYAVFILLFIMVAVAASAFLAYWNITNHRAQALQSVEKRQELQAQGKVSVISTWLESLSQQGDRLINSDIFRIYASEVDKLEGDASVLLSETGQEMLQEQGDEDEDVFMLSAQQPMMARLLDEFVSYSGFLSGRVINRKGQSYIATDASTVSMSEEQETMAGACLEDGLKRYTSLRTTPTGLVMDLFLPILQTTLDGDAGEPVSVLMLSKLMTGKVTEFLASVPLAGQNYQIHLVQRGEGGVQQIVPWLPEGLRSVPNAELFSGDAVPFGQRTSVDVSDDGAREVFSMGLKMPELDWWVMVEIDFETINKDLMTYDKTVISIAVLVALAVILLLGVFWWWGIGRENKEVAEQFRRLAEQINAQKALVDSINATIPELVALKNGLGEYVYVNEAFARAAGREVEEILGMDDAAVFGFDTAKRLARSDDKVRDTGRATRVDETIWLMSRKYHFHISKVPFHLDDDDKAILSVLRDNTDIVEAQELSRRVVQNTIDALVRTIEKIDPYLGGHTRLMGAFSLEMARSLQMRDQDLATVEAAANLSQIGKMFVDPAILNKPGKLTDDELKEMQRHVEYAENLLKDIDFDLPVVDAIVQMNENPDGSGYPRGLKEEQIILPARLLAVANGFCALIKPRAYRPAKSVAEALDLLESLPGKFSPDLVAVLKEIVYSPVGEKLLKELMDVQA